MMNRLRASIAALAMISVIVSVAFFDSLGPRVERFDGKDRIQLTRLSPDLPVSVEDQGQTDSSTLNNLIGMTLSEALSFLNVEYSKCKLNDEPPGVIQIIRIESLAKLPGVHGVDLILIESVFDRTRTWPFQLVKNIKVDDVVLHKH